MARSNKGFIMMYTVALIGLGLIASMMISTVFVTKMTTMEGHKRNAQFENAIISAENWYTVNYQMKDKVMEYAETLPVVIRGQECEVTISPVENNSIEIRVKGEKFMKTQTIGIGQ